jgi:hypothetical protein
MSEDSEDLDEQIKSRKRARREDTRGNDRKFESGSEEEYVVGNTRVQKQND